MTKNLNRKRTDPRAYIFVPCSRCLGLYGCKFRPKQKKIIYLLKK